jgi:hypothetical protein
MQPFPEWPGPENAERVIDLYSRMLIIPKQVFVTTRGWLRVVGKAAGDGVLKKKNPCDIV